MFAITNEMLASMSSLNNVMVESVLEFWCSFSKILFSNQGKEEL